MASGGYVYVAPTGLQVTSIQAKPVSTRHRSPHLAMVRKNKQGPDTVLRIHPLVKYGPRKEDYKALLSVKRQYLCLSELFLNEALRDSYRASDFKWAEHWQLENMRFDLAYKGGGTAHNRLGTPASIPIQGGEEPKPYRQHYVPGLHLKDGVCLYAGTVQPFTIVVHYPPHWSAYRVE